MRPRLELLPQALVGRILGDALELLHARGVRVASLEAVELLRAAGAEVEGGDSVRIPEKLVRTALESVPREFFLYDRRGGRAVRYGGDAVHFDPGSSCLNILDPATRRPRPAVADDLVRMVQVTEMLPQFAAQSTAMVCSDVPSELGDFYRLLLVLWHSEKPVVTGAFSAAGLGPMRELLQAEAGGAEALKASPRAVFDVCPSPPMNWTEFAARNLVELARAGVPAEMVSMPLAGAAAPVTLAGAVTQHAAESLAGIVIHQAVNPGAPIVWGGAPAIFDMRTGTAPMGAMETAMLDAACALVGKSLGLPTHGYLCASDSKLVDAQAGMESGMSAMLGALAGINMISGAGMLDFLACHSVEKLVIDAEAIASVQRLLAGVQERPDTLAMFAAAGKTGDFLRLKETRALFREEQHFPSEVIQRGDECSGDSFERARQRAGELVAGYRRPALAPQREAAMRAVAERQAARCGLRELPGMATCGASATC